MFRDLRWLIVGGAIGALVIGAFNLEKLLDRYAPFDLRDLPGWLTPVQLHYLRANSEKCFAVLARSEIQITRQQYPLNDRGCGFDDGALMSRSNVSYGGGVLLRCPALASLILWERHVLQPEAERVLKKKVRAVRSLGTFSCRNINRQKDGRLSQHATANAIDIAGFTFDDGSSVSVLKDWGKGENGEFLRAVHRGGCRFFNGALSPDYNAAHANHFHFDLGWRVCR